MRRGRLCMQKHYYIYIFFYSLFPFAFYLCPSAESILNLWTWRRRSVDDLTENLTTTSQAKVREEFLTIPSRGPKEGTACFHLFIFIFFFNFSLVDLYMGWIALFNVCLFQSGLFTLSSSLIESREICIFCPMDGDRLMVVHSLSPIRSIGCSILRCLVTCICFPRACMFDSTLASSVDRDVAKRADVCVGWQWTREGDSILMVSTPIQHFLYYLFAFIHFLLFPLLIYGHASFIFSRLLV